MGIYSNRSGTGNGIGKGIEVRLGTKWMSGKERITHPEFRTATGIVTGIGTGIGKGIEVGFKGRKKKDAVNDHILLRNKTKYVIRLIRL